MRVRSVVLPDRKTVYLNDDAGRSGGFVKFVALEAGDMSKGEARAHAPPLLLSMTASLSASAAGM